ncbi:hypothetical protein ACHHYP_01856 [Achlya hypogyna]|uniref:WLM domain-containing protein n=1 Tax=Achlya hypogyna TaxID=1202772 RepID=A0A1V9Z7W0_ACHHY|nr:hypothetical protein ACHHYP_01856 [Achlya hypogyna]
MEWRIPRIQALKQQPRHEEAQNILERIESYVLPIMAKRKYKVRQLLEFFPKDTNLLGMNVNHGWKIYVRLRPAARPSTFFPFEELLGTMLHELVHMEIGPHNTAFYKLLDELKSEMELLMAQGLTGGNAKRLQARLTSYVGITGSQFIDAGIGHSLGGTRALHGSSVRLAGDAAIARMRHHALVGANGTCRLGGDATATADALTPAMLRQRALEAAERRRRDQLVCGTLETPPVGIGEAAAEAFDAWACGQCTYLNDARQPTCVMCGGGSKKRKRSYTIDLTASPPRSRPAVIDLT